MAVYAETADLQSHLGEGVALPSNAEKLLERASELVDSYTSNRAFGYWAAPLPDPPTIQQVALRKATVAQVEFWMETGEEFDIVAVEGSSVGIGALNISKLPSKLAPRARRALLPVGLLYAGVATVDDTWGI